MKCFFNKKKKKTICQEKRKNSLRLNISNFSRFFNKRKIKILFKDGKIKHNTLRNI